MAGLVFAVVLVLATYMDSVLNVIQTRFQSVDLTGGRMLIYKSYLQALFDSPVHLLFGSGMQDYPVKYQVTAGGTDYIATHNVLLEVVSMWGLFGTLLVVALVLSLYKALGTRAGFLANHAAYLPALGLFTMALAGQFFAGYYYSLPSLMIALANIKYGSTMFSSARRIAAHQPEGPAIP